MTLRGELVYYPEYGCNAQLALGLKADPVIRLMAAAWVQESLQKETRLASILGVDAVVDGDKLKIGARVMAVGDNTPQDFNVVTP
jgi:hypothetical protein